MIHIYVHVDMWDFDNNAANSFFFMAVSYIYMTLLPYSELNVCDAVPTSKWGSLLFPIFEHTWARHITTHTCFLLGFWLRICEYQWFPNSILVWVWMHMTFELNGWLILSLGSWTCQICILAYVICDSIRQSISPLYAYTSLIALSICVPCFGCLNSRY